jgi:uncharacterized protein (UPF0335 family)
MTTINTASARQLRAFIERIERLEEEKKALGGDVRDVYLEAKGCGFDVATMRSVIRLRRKTTAERQEAEALLETYLEALDMQGDMFRAADNNGDETTISLNGGPAHPFSVVKEAVRMVREAREAEAAE